MNAPLMPEPSSWASRRISLRTRIVAANIIALSLLLGVLGVVIHYTVTAAMLSAVDRDLESRASSFTQGGPPRRQPPPPGSGTADSFRSDSMQPSPPNGPPPGFPPDSFGPQGGQPERASADAFRPRRFSLSGQELGPGRQTPWDAAGFAQAARGGVVYATITVNGQRLRVLSQPFPPHGSPRGVVQAVYPLSDLDPAFSGLDRALLTLIPVGLLCAGLAGAFLTDSVLRRVRRTTLAAAHIDATDFSRRLPITGNDEFSEMAETFNRLLSRQEDAYRRQQALVEHQRRFTADASHELKTPLTIIQGNTSIAREASPETMRQALQEIDMAAKTMAHLVQDLLMLARSDGGQLAQRPIEVLAGEILARAISRSRPAAAPISLELADETLTMTGNETELVRLMTNLVDNAAQHTPPDGRIIVSAQQFEGHIVLSVTDTGPGIAPEHLPHLGQRFYRIDTARARQDGGTGLGLSICKAIAEAHGGSLQIRSQVGHGTMAVVSLPVTLQTPSLSAHPQGAELP